MQVNMGLIVIVGCFVAMIMGMGSAIFFAKRNKDDGDLLGTVLSIIAAIPFFVSLCYLMWRVIEKAGESI